LVQEQGRKKSLDEIKASIKQAVHIPSNLVSLAGKQLLLFVVTSSIFFGGDSVCSECLKHHLHLVRQNKKASVIRSCLTNSLLQDSFLQSTGDSKGGFECVSKQQY
jgi:hypothetical protein